MTEEKEDYYFEWTLTEPDTYEYKTFTAIKNGAGSWSLFHNESWESDVPDFEYIKDYVEILEQYNAEREGYC